MPAHGTPENEARTNDLSAGPVALESGDVLKIADIEFSFQLPPKAAHANEVRYSDSHRVH